MRFMGIMGREYPPPTGLGTFRGKKGKLEICTGPGARPRGGDAATANEQLDAEYGEPPSITPPI